MASVSIDTSEVAALAADLGRVSAKVQRAAQGVIEKGANNIKRQMVSEAEGSRHFRLARTISYDMSLAGMQAEIGPTRGGAGSLAGIAYFGGINGGGGTIPDPEGALLAEAPNVERYLLQIVGEAL